MSDKCKKFGLLICSGGGARKNIGDYIQSIAQRCFLPRVDVLVEREQLKNFSSDVPTKTIMNAWYMKHPENFPPSDCIDPLFVSVHITPKVAGQIMTAETIDYLKHHEPIGARDTYTLELLQQHGIESYFSGCLTLTLGQKYHSEKKNGKVYIIDPYYTLGGYGNPKWRKLRACLFLLRHFPMSWHLRNKIKTHTDTPLSRKFPRFYRLLCAASFYVVYRTLFTDDLLRNACYVTHDIKQADYPTDDSKLALAESLLNQYAEASYVITSRIHAALPCLGIGTDVLFVTGAELENGQVRSAGRFGGLVDLMHTIRYESEKLYPTTPAIKETCQCGKLGVDTRIPEAPFATNHDFVDNMAERVRRFVAAD